MNVIQRREREIECIPVLNTKLDKTQKNSCWSSQGPLKSVRFVASSINTKAISLISCGILAGSIRYFHFCRRTWISSYSAPLILRIHVLVVSLSGISTWEQFHSGFIFYTGIILVISTSRLAGRHLIACPRMLALLVTSLSKKLRPKGSPHMTLLTLTTIRRLIRLQFLI